MDTLLIKGGVSLNGEISISGAKNAVLPIMISSLLTEEPVTIRRIPYLKDVSNTMQLLAGLNVDITVDYVDQSSTIFQAVKKNLSSEPPTDVASMMRASILSLGPLMVRLGKARLIMPGGCVIGDRPIDIHLEGLKQMGADFSQSHDNWIIGHVDGRLKGSDISLRNVSVTGTENLIMAAVLAEGTTILRNTAKEPEVVDLANCLITMGAKISGHGSDVITIEGVEKLGGTDYTIMPDRIEAATYLVAGAMTKGKVRVCDVIVEHLQSTIIKLKEAGVRVTTGPDWVEVDAIGCTLKAIDLTTQPFPGFPTDMQAQFVALNSISEGKGQIMEEVFEGRFHHVEELIKMGALLKVNGNCVESNGIKKLKGADITASDLRASASLVLAALIAEDTSIIHKVYHIDRGYELIEEKLRKLGAIIYRLHSSEELSHDYS